MSIKANYLSQRNFCAYSFSICLLSLFLLLSCSQEAQQSSKDNDDQKESVEDEEQGDTADIEDIKALPGFEVELIYEVPEDQGSWVSLTTGPEGKLYASDQYDKGTYEVTVKDTEDTTKVNVKEVIIPITGAQGMTWAFGYLYVNVNGKGLFRLKDTQNNGIFDVLEYLGGPMREGEHGNHTVLPTPDGKGLYVVNGNHTSPPEFTSSRVSSWELDNLLPRLWDPRGHARGILVPGGRIVRIDPDASEWELVSMGYRNTYDAAVSPEGELFTYDNDMEWDMGLPWYRPTRILHAVSGSDYGWRSGSGKWKAYYEDSLPPLYNIGPGSPTALLFGTDAKFPARYQRALYAVDWTFGTIYALHLTAEGASYTAEAEEFLSGSPLPLTDAVIGDDGAMYFTTGGRKKGSKLYRVVYRGDKSTAPAESEENPEAKQARELRHSLEAFHGHKDPRAVETAWPYLDNDDRFLRYAARMAVEAQPPETWAPKVFLEDRTQAKITGLVALARTGSEDYRDKATQSLIEMELDKLSTEQKLGYLRAMALTFMRLGDPDEQERAKIVDTLEEALPTKDDRVNMELVRNLVYLGDPQVIDKVLEMLQDEKQPKVPDWDKELIARNEDYGGPIEDMFDNPPPTTKLAYVYMLRNMSDGWTIDQRREYFKFINKAGEEMGGFSYTGYLEQIRDEALVKATEEEREAVADLTSKSLAPEPPFEITAPEGPGRDWTIDEAVKAVEGKLANRDFENGRNAFFASSCGTCHSIEEYGGDIGPNLGWVAPNKSADVLLEDIITPSAVISSQYNSSEVKLKNGKTVTGLAVEEEEYVKVYSRDPDTAPKIYPREEVDAIEPSETSQMPSGLINSLNEEELKDLIAYLKSGGDAENEMFQESD